MAEGKIYYLVCYELCFERSMLYNILSVIWVSVGNRVSLVGVEVSKAYAYCQLNRYNCYPTFELSF